MRMQEQDRQIMTNVGNSAGFTIQNNAKMFSILSSGIYEDPIRAIIRELSCNALDSHIEAGTPDLPFRVKLPSRFDPRLQIEDYGIGLDHEGVTQLYTTYGMSTKTSSNDVIGALGLGSKTPFSYAETFSVRARKDGVERWYNAYIGNEGFPSISMLSEQPTEEPNGMMIEVAVKESDCQRFRDKAIQVFKYFKMIPEGLPESIEREVRSFAESMYGDFDDEGFYVSPAREQRFVAVMGNIGYRIPMDIIRNTRQDFLQFIEMKHGRSSEINLHFKIGELDIAASRESLSFSETDEDPTYRAIQQRLDDTVGRYIDEMQEQLDQCEAWPEACRMVMDEGLEMVASLFTFQGRSMRDWINHRVHPSNVLLKRTVWESTEWNSARRVPYKFRRFDRLDSRMPAESSITAKTFAMRPHILYINDTGSERGIPTTLDWWVKTRDDDSQYAEIIGMVEPTNKKAIQRLQDSLPGLVVRPISPLVARRQTEMAQKRKNRTQEVGKYESETEIKARWYSVRMGSNQKQAIHDIAKLKGEFVKVVYYYPRNGRTTHWELDGKFFGINEIPSSVMGILGIDRVIYANKSNLKRIQKNKVPSLDSVIKAKRPVFSKMLDAYLKIAQSHHFTDMKQRVRRCMETSHSDVDMDRLMINFLSERGHIPLEVPDVSKEERQLGLMVARHLYPWKPSCTSREIRFRRGLSAGIDMFKHNERLMECLTGRDVIPDEDPTEVAQKYAAIVDNFYEDYPLIAQIRTNYPIDNRDKNDPVYVHLEKIINECLDNWNP